MPTEVGPIALIELHPALAVAVHDRHRRGRRTSRARFDTSTTCWTPPGRLDKVRFLGTPRGKERPRAARRQRRARCRHIHPGTAGQRRGGQARQGLRCVGAQGPLEHGPNVVGAVHPPQGASDVVAPAKGFNAMWPPRKPVMPVPRGSGASKRGS